MALSHNAPYIASEKNSQNTSSNSTITRMYAYQPPPPKGLSYLPQPNYLCAHCSKFLLSVK